MNPIVDAVYSRFRRHPRQFFKLSDEFRPAIRISAIIQRVHPDENVVRAYYLSPGQSVAKEDCVSRRHVGNGNSACHLVRAEPPNPRKSISITRCSLTPKDLATCSAESISIS